jgi:hypothetical protein
MSTSELSESRLIYYTGSHSPRGWDLLFVLALHHSLGNVSLFCALQLLSAASSVLHMFPLLSVAALFAAKLTSCNSSSSGFVEETCVSTVFMMVDAKRLSGSVFFFLLIFLPLDDGFSGPCSSPCTDESSSAESQSLGRMSAKNRRKVGIQTHMTPTFSSTLDHTPLASVS